MAKVGIKKNANVRLKSVALPVEQGRWSVLVEPILLALLLAPSIAGFWLSLAALGIFLVQQPAAIVIKNWRKDEHYTRTMWALRFTVGYLLLALIGLVMAVN